MAVTTKPRIDKKAASKLPNEPSALIRVALKDLLAIEQDNRYSVNMDRWHCPTSYNTCEVCLAGSVIAKTLKMPLLAALDGLSHLKPDDIQWKLEFLDGARLNYVVDILLDSLSLNMADIPDSVRRFDSCYTPYRDLVQIPDYHENRNEFHRRLHQLADALEAAGL